MARKVTLTEYDPNSTLTSIKKSLQFADDVSAVPK